MKINMTDKYQTRDGKPVRVLCVDRRFTHYPVLALVGEEDELISYTSEGVYPSSGAVSCCDLVPVPKVIKGWINVFEDGTQMIHGSQEAADSAAELVHDTRIACIYFEGKEGEGL